MQTLEQRRAENTWNVSADYTKAHANIAKSLPALIMNSGLMQVLAFTQNKDPEHKRVALDLCSWLNHQFNLEVKDFKGFMERLFHASPQDYQAFNAEAFAWLKWLRQMASARLASQTQGDA